MASVKKQFYQILIENFKWIIIGIFAFGQVLDAVANSYSFFTNVNVAITVSIILLCLYLIILILFRKKRIKWISKDGQSLNVKNINKGLVLSCVGCLILLWIPPLFPTLTQASFQSEKLLAKPFFDSLDTRFKILILPFDKECEYMGLNYDIGKVISKRLENIAEKDTVNLTTHYFDNLYNLSNLKDKEADSLRKYHNADLIIYGVYSFKQCEVNSDKICINYQVDTAKWNFTKNDYQMRKSNYQMVSLLGLESLRGGVAQEPIDYIIYKVAAYSAWSKLQYNRMIYLLKKIKNYNETPNFLCLIGIGYKELKNYYLAEYWLKKSLKIDTSIFSTWFYLGNCYLDQGKYQQSITFLQKSLSSQLEYGDKEIVYNSLGLAYAYLGNDVKALEFYEKGLEISPTSSIILRNIGLVYSRNGDHQNSILFFNRALKLNSNFYYALLNLAQEYALLNKYSEGKANIDNYLKDNPANSFTNFELAQIYLELKSFTKAKTMLEAALKLAPNNDTIWVTLGLTLSDMNAFDEAVNSYIEALKINPNNIDALNNLAYCYNYTAHYLYALHPLERALELEPDNPNVLYNLGLSHSMLRHKKEAIYYLKCAIYYTKDSKMDLIKNRAFNWLRNDKDFIQAIRTESKHPPKPLKI
jgi:tetratricopeptide (TPR) repeat protein